MSELVDEVRARLIENHQEPTTQAIAAAVADHAPVLGPSVLSEKVRQIHRELTGAGPLQPFLDDPAVTDVLVNAPDETWVDRGRGLERVRVDLGSPAALRELAVRLAGAAGQRLDDARPTVDGRLADGTRLHAVLAPLVDSAAVISLRVPRHRTLGLAELVAGGAVPASWHEVLAAIVVRRLSFLVSGATGSGKTTVLAGLLALVPHDERIVLVEEARELRIEHPHVVALASRRANVEGRGEVGLAELVRESLRMRPDRVVLGECRGAEVRDLLTALNTGHEGGCATIHANSAADVPARLVALGMLAGIPADVVAEQAVCAIDVVVHLGRSGGRRWVAEIAVVRRGDGERGQGEQDGGDGAPDRRGPWAGPPPRLVAETALAWDGTGEPRVGPAWGRLARRLGLVTASDGRTGGAAVGDGGVRGRRR